MSRKISKIYLWKNFLKFFFDDNVLNRNFFENYFFFTKKIFWIKKPTFPHKVDSSKPWLDPSHPRFSDKWLRWNSDDRKWTTTTFRCSRAIFVAVHVRVFQSMNEGCSPVSCVNVPAWLFPRCCGSCSRVVVLEWLFPRSCSTASAVVVPAR